MYFNSQQNPFGYVSLQSNIPSIDLSQFNLPTIDVFGPQPTDQTISPENASLAQDAFELWCKTNPFCQVWQNSENGGEGLIDRFSYTIKNSVLLVIATFIFGLGVYLMTRQTPIVGKYVP